MLGWCNQSSRRHGDLAFGIPSFEECVYLLLTFSCTAENEKRLVCVRVCFTQLSSYEKIHFAPSTCRGRRIEVSRRNRRAEKKNLTTVSPRTPNHLLAQVDQRKSQSQQPSTDKPVRKAVWDKWRFTINYFKVFSLKKYVEMMGIIINLLKRVRCPSESQDAHKCIQTLFISANPVIVIRIQRWKSEHMQATSNMHNVKMMKCNKAMARLYNNAEYVISF